MNDPCKRSYKALNPDSSPEVVLATRPKLKSGDSHFVIDNISVDMDETLKTIQSKLEKPDVLDDIRQ